jgi:MFS family permease
MTEKSDKLLFWGCYVALITTSYAFISRVILCGGQFKTDFGLDAIRTGELIGAGIWPFGISIILFSFIIDRVGYKLAMLFSFACYVIYAAMAFMAHGAVHGVTGDALPAAQERGYSLLYWGSIILGLGNGTVEAYINPIVATVFKTEKTKWLNILHAGWPTGLVAGGIVMIALSDNTDWRLNLGIILVPAVAFLVMLIGRTFPRSEREQAGVGYMEMLKELGAFGGLVGFGLVISQLGQVFAWPHTATWILTGLAVGAFAFLTRSFGRPILAVLILIMMPLATTELGTDGWITALMEAPMKAAGHNAAWVLVYTSAIMVVLRTVAAGPIVSRMSPLGMLALSAVLAIAGLLALSQTAGSSMLTIFAAATLYGIGKSFFWPTMLGVAAEQCPKGGALTLNTLGGIGMLAVGILGAPFIGYLQESTATKELAAANQAVYAKVTIEKSYLLGDYRAIDPAKAEQVTDADGKAALAKAGEAGQFGALARIAMFPGLMLVTYLGMMLYYKSRGGYKPVALDAAH